MTAESGDRADDRPEVARIGHAIQCDQQRHPTARNDLVEQVGGVCVLIRRNLEREPLVHRVKSRETVELGAHDLEDRQATLGGDLHDLLDAVVIFDAGRDVEGGHRDLGAESLEHGVAAGDDLELVRLLWFADASGRALRCTGARRTLPAGRGEAVARRLALSRGMIGAVNGLRCGLLALECLAALAAGAHLLARAAFAHGTGTRLVGSTALH